MKKLMSEKDRSKVAHPSTVDYEELLAQESLILDAQIAIQRVLNERNVSQRDLAGRLGVSESYVSQMLGDSPRNLTLRSIARVMYALGETALLTTRKLAKGFEEPVRPYQCDAEFGPWGEIITLDSGIGALNHSWAAEEWAANENENAPAALANAA